MAVDIIKQPVSSDNLPVSLLATNNFELVNTSVRKVDDHILVGSVILKCISNWNSNDYIFTLNLRIPTYTFLMATVSASQWNYAVTRVTRWYYNTGGRINSNTSYTAGEYITIAFNVGL